MPEPQPRRPSDCCCPWNEWLPSAQLFRRSADHWLQPKWNKTGSKWFSMMESAMSQRELNQPHEKRYQRRNEDGTFGESDDQSKSLSQDVKQHAKTKKPKNEGDKGD